MELVPFMKETGEIPRPFCQGGYSNKTAISEEVGPQQTPNLPTPRSWSSQPLEL